MEAVRLNTLNAGSSAGVLIPLSQTKANNVSRLPTTTPSSLSPPHPPPRTSFWAIVLVHPWGRLPIHGTLYRHVPRPLQSPALRGNHDARKQIRRQTNTWNPPNLGTPSTSASTAAWPCTVHRKCQSNNILSSIWQTICVSWIWNGSNSVMLSSRQDLLIIVSPHADRSKDRHFHWFTRDARLSSPSLRSRA